MRVGLEVSYAFMGRGGIDRYAYGLAKALQARDDGNAYVLLTMFPPFVRAGLDGAPIRSGLRRKLAMAQVEALRRVWSRVDYPTVERLAGPLDVVHTTHHFSAPVRNARRVATVHDLSFEHPGFGVATSRTFARDTRRAVANADAVIVPSRFTKRELTERYGVAPDRVRVVYSGVDAERWQPREPRSFEGPPYFLAVGQLEARKNLLELAEGLGIARERHGLSHRLVVCGRIGRSGKAIADTLEWLPHVDYRGFVGDAGLRDLYAHATGFAYPSLYEGFGMSVLEAMAAGAPVIAAAATSLPEVVGDAGLLVEPGDAERWAEALGRMASDDELRRSLIAAGRARAGEFTWERAADATAQVYSEVAAA